MRLAFDAPCRGRPARTALMHPELTASSRICARPRGLLPSLVPCPQVTREERHRLRLQHKRGAQASKRKDEKRLKKDAEAAAGTVKVTEMAGAKGGKASSKKRKAAPERHHAPSILASSRGTNARLHTQSCARTHSPPCRSTATPADPIWPSGSKRFLWLPHPRSA